MDKLLAEVEAICERAGEAILTIYNRSADTIAIQTKSDDTPVTEADFAANKVILASLPKLLEGVPIVSEESAIPKFEERKRWSRYWLVDPLDGTREFIRRNGEFTVNIALVENGIPVLGVVHAPVLNTTYSGIRDLGAWKREEKSLEPIFSRPLAKVIQSQEPFLVVGSRSFGIPPLPVELSEQFDSIETRSIGSSLKFCLLAEGKADFYPRFGPTKEWDTAAAQVVLEAAGGIVKDVDGNLLRYNQKENLSNSDFYAMGDKSFNWRALYGK